MTTCRAPSRSSRARAGAPTSSRSSRLASTVPARCTSCSFRLRSMLPIDRPGKIICVGLNYRDHAEEQGADLPVAPLLFAKWNNTLIGPGEPIAIPPIVTKTDYEAELGVVIGSAVTRVSAENALEAVAGYICVNDVSARDLQFADGQWTRGKSPDSYCP